MNTFGDTHIRIVPIHSWHLNRIGLSYRHIKSFYRAIWQWSTYQIFFTEKRADKSDLIEVDCLSGTVVI